MIKCKMKIDRIMFSKNKEIISGDFVIFTAKIIKHLEGEVPVVHNFFKTVTLKGTVPAIEVGNVLDIRFENPEVNKFGTSYNVVSITKDFNPKDKKELMDYLVLMCGNTIAKELIKLENPYELLKERRDNELLRVKGVGETRLQQIYHKIDSFSDNTLAFVKLEPLGLTKNLIKKICLSVGGADSAVDICFNNPYLLIGKVDGVGFKIADAIGIKCGIDRFSTMRIKSAINHILQENGELGKSYLFSHQLLQEIKKIVDVDFSFIDKIVREMLISKELCISNDGMKVALPYYIKLEQDIAKEIIRIRDAESKIKIPENWIETIKNLESKQGWKHTEEQLEGIKMSLNNNVLLVSGKAGSGKSTVTNAMREILKDYDISLCCLSAKASQRLREVTGTNATTIHKLIGLSINDDTTEEVYSDVIIIDEASMINGGLFLKLLKNIRSGSKVVVLGDDGQLSAIGNCSVFSDLMLSKKVPHIELTKIHRQAEKSAIITKSIDFRNQIKICENDFSGHKTMGELQDLELYILEEEMLLSQIKQEFIKGFREIGDLLEVQVITALKTRGVLSVQNINNEIQSLVNSRSGSSFEGVNKTKIFVGDKVINLKNNYSAKNINGNKVGVWNGSIGIVEKIDKEVVINFVGIGKIIIDKSNFNNINLAYAINCHSSQGSQWKRVICAFDISAYVLLSVELIYTAITRASEHCSLIMDRASLNHASRTVEQKTKQTFLPMFINNPN